MNEKNRNTQDIDMKCLECETIEIEENKQISLKEDTLTRVLAFWPSAIVSLMAISMSAYHLYVAYRGSPEWLFHRSIHIMFAMFIGFVICKGIKKDNRFVRAIDFSLAGVSVAIWGYVMIHYQRIVTHWYMVDSLSITDYVIGVALILLILELTRRTTGWALVFVSLFFMFHTLYASHFPGFLKGTSTPISTFLEYMFMMSDGFYGSSIGTSASYVFLFVMLGAFLEDTGVGDYFMRLATEFTNCSRGGPAKSAIIASGLFGSISGSAVANVYATGVFTIPLMKRAGFKPHFAGACEAVASSGGAIMPPVMGSAAFLMADFVGVPYATIAKSALIPAILYYVSLWFFVDMEAQKMGMKRQPKVCAIDIPYYLRNSFLIAPIGVIIWMLIAGYSAFLAAFYAILCTILCGVIKNIHFLNPKNILKTLEKAGKQSVSIAIPLACAGLVVCCKIEREKGLF